MKTEGRTERKWRRSWAIIVAAVLVMLGHPLAQAKGPTTSPSAAETLIHFIHVDVLVDPLGRPLAAYQVEIVADPQRVTLVGIEGGEHPAYAQPPYYDPKALNSSRVILAALSTAEDLPRHRTRIARLHLRVVGAARPAFSSRLIVAASSADRTIDAKVLVSEGASQ